PARTASAPLSRWTSAEGGAGAAPRSAVRITESGVTPPRSVRGFARLVGRPVPVAARLLRFRAPRLTGRVPAGVVGVLVAPASPIGHVLRGLVGRLGLGPARRLRRLRRRRRVGPRSSELLRQRLWKRRRCHRLRGVQLQRLVQGQPSARGQVLRLRREGNREDQQCSSTLHENSRQQRTCPPPPSSPPRRRSRFPPRADVPSRAAA